jgi:diguanylate cyclase (GGDEF)-like protein/PAS domain S-box-containing protein
MDRQPELTLIASLQQRLEEAEGNHARMVEAFEHLESGVILYGSDDRIVFCNRRFREIYREVVDLLVPGTLYADVARTFYQRGYEHRTNLDEESYVRARLEKHLDPDDADYEYLLGDDVWVLVSDRKTADGGVIGFRLDITARKQAEEKLAQSEQRLKSLLDMSSDWYWEQDEQFRFTHISGGMVRSTGVDPKERYGRPRWEVPYLGISPEQMEEHRRQVEAREPFRDFQYAYAMPDGDIRWVSVSGQPVIGVGGEFIGYRGVGSNITEKKRADARIRELAEYDFLTGLPNRLLLSTRFDFAVRQARRDGSGIALLFIDLDRFKNINDSLGHDVGDQILIETANRITQSMRATDTVARHGGDEFIVLLPGVADAKDLVSITDLVLQSLTKAYSIAGHELTVTPSIGITVWPDDGVDLASLVKNADLAMYHSKAEGRNQFSFFRAEMNERAMERLSIENALRRALPRNELKIVYQPIFHLPGRQIIGAEALLRWQSGTLGDMLPTRFVPVAEETGLIIAIGEWVAKEAIAQLRRWRDAGLDHFPVSINVSATQFKTRRLIDVLMEAIGEHGLAASDVEIELTETALVSEGDSTMSTLFELGALGFRLVVDDFGTGYSNLGYLKRFDIDKLKIDQSFVRDISTDPDDAAITRGIISLAKSLGMRAVAEGVEYATQLDFLLASGCEEAQGYLLSRPLTPAELQAHY